MSEPKRYVKHKQKGEVFEFLYNWKENRFTCCVDTDGEVRSLESRLLEPYEPEEAWEDVPATHIAQMSDGLVVWVNGYQHPVPSPYTRTIMRDGKLVVQRRKAS